MALRLLVAAAVLGGISPGLSSLLPHLAEAQGGVLLEMGYERAPGGRDIALSVQVRGCNPGQFLILAVERSEEHRGAHPLASFGPYFQGSVAVRRIGGDDVKFTTTLDVDVLHSRFGPDPAVHALVAGGGFSIDFETPIDPQTGRPLRESKGRQGVDAKEFRDELVEVLPASQQEGTHVFRNLRIRPLDTPPGTTAEVSLRHPQVSGLLEMTIPLKPAD